MPPRPLKPVLAAALSLGLAVPALPVAAQVPGPNADKPGDGVVSAAACAAFGFTLPTRGPDRPVHGVTGPAMTAPPPPPPPPPPDRARRDGRAYAARPDPAVPTARH